MRRALSLAFVLLVAQLLPVVAEDAQERADAFVQAMLGELGAAPSECPEYSAAIPDNDELDLTKTCAKIKFLTRQFKRVWDRSITSNYDSYAEAQGEWRGRAPVHYRYYALDGPLWLLVLFDSNSRFLMLCSHAMEQPSTVHIQSDAARNPYIAGENGVTTPKLVSKVQPTYPNKARLAGKSGLVILGSLVQSDGSVGRITVLHVNPTDYGFEEEAVEAVRQWRYEPAILKRERVDVFFTIILEFKPIP